MVADGRARQPHGVGYRGHGGDAVAGVAGQLPADAARAHLWVVEGLGDGVDGAAGHGLVLQQGDPLGGAAGLQDGLHQRQQRSAVLHACGIGGKACVLCPFGVAARLAKARELSVVADRQQHVAVAAAKVLVGRQAGVDVAGASGRLPGGQVARRLVGQHGHAHVEQSHVDVLPFAGAVAGVVARVQRGQDGVAGVQAGEHVHHGHADLQRPATGLPVGMAGDAHQAAHGLHHQVIAGAFGIRPVLAEAGDGAVDQARVQRFQAGVVQPILRQTADLEILDHHVGLGGHAAQQRLALGVGHVHGDAALVAVAGGEVAGLARVAASVVLQEGRAPVARVVTGLGALDLDHVGAQIGQHLGAPGTGKHARKIQYLDTVQGAAGGGSTHEIAIENVAARACCAANSRIKTIELIAG